MSRARAWVALVLLALAAARCGTRECEPVYSADTRATRLVFTRLGRDEAITSLVLMAPGERVPFAVDPGVTLAADRGTVQQSGGASTGTYTAPVSGTDRIGLRYSGIYGNEERGWVAVRVSTADPRNVETLCQTQARGEVPPGGRVVIHRRRISTVHLNAETSCAITQIDVPIYHLPVGARMPVYGPGDTRPSTIVLEPGKLVADLVDVRGGSAIAALSPGRSAVELILTTPGGAVACRSVLLVEVEHEACADGGVDGGGASPDATADASTDAGGDVGTDAGTDAGSDGGVDAARDAGSDGGVDVATDAGSDAGSDASEAAVDAGAAPASFELGDVLPIGLVAFDGGLYWYDNADHGLHRFDLTTLADRVVLAETSVLLRDIVAADGRLFWATGPSGPSQVVAWRPGDAAPSAPLLTASRAFDQLTGDGTRLYAHEQDALRWSRYDGTGVGSATSSSGHRAFAAAGGRIYFADLGLFGATRGVFRVPTTPDPTTLLASRETVLRADYVLDDTVLPSSLLVDGDVACGLGQQRLLRVRADGVTAPSELARLPASAAGTGWSRMCLARGRLYMVDQFQARLWSVPVDGSAAVSAVASPATSGVAFSLACTADSVWWWSGPRLNRYRLP